MPEHDLIIGGSGMLAGLVETLARRGRHVSVIARGRERLQSLAERHPNIHPLPLDYRDDTALDAGLAQAVRDHGALQRCVAWMHDDSEQRAVRIARQVGAVYCEVLGSASADPARPAALEEWQSLFQAPALPKLLLAVLGFVTEGGHSRWLTNDEISSGVGRALESEEPVTIVGTVTPWSARP
jgi:NAD(P)-dependent dehydrogenase (short-subunit alcohol dehydrogenase family)